MINNRSKEILSIIHYIIMIFIFLIVTIYFDITSFQNDNGISIFIITVLCILNGLTFFNTLICFSIIQLKIKTLKLQKEYKENGK